MNVYLEKNMNKISGRWRRDEQGYFSEITIPLQMTEAQIAAVDQDAFSRGLKENLAELDISLSETEWLSWTDEMDDKKDSGRLCLYTKSKNLINEDVLAAVIEDADFNIGRCLPDNLKNDHMKGPWYRVYLGSEPMTVPILDEKRAALAYNVMSILGKNGVYYDRNGSPERITTDKLRMLNEAGEEISPDPDPEWQDGRSEEVRDEVLDRTMEAVWADGNNISREEGAEYQEQFTIGSKSIFPATWDWNKANEMCNLMINGTDPLGTFSVPNKNGELEALSSKPLLINTDGDVRRFDNDPEWAFGKMSEDVIELDDGKGFADAVASLSKPDFSFEQ